MQPACLVSFLVFIHKFLCSDFGLLYFHVSRCDVVFVETCVTLLHVGIMIFTAIRRNRKGHRFNCKGEPREK